MRWICVGYGDIARWIWRHCTCASQRRTQSKKEHLKVIRIINAHILRLHSPISVAVVEGDVVCPVLVALVHSASKELLSTARLLVSCLSPLSPPRPARKTAASRRMHRTVSTGQRHMAQAGGQRHKTCAWSTCRRPHWRQRRQQTFLEPLKLGSSRGTAGGQYVATGGQYVPTDLFRALEASRHPRVLH
jgi:hypothetical protein